MTRYLLNSNAVTSMANNRTPFNGSFGERASAWLPNRYLRTCDRRVVLRIGNECVSPFESGIDVAMSEIFKSDGHSIDMRP